MAIRADLRVYTESGDFIEDGVNKQNDFIIIDEAERTAEPEYLTIQARSDDATCVTCTLLPVCSIRRINRLTL